MAHTASVSMATSPAVSPSSTSTSTFAKDYDDSDIEDVSAVEEFKGEFVPDFVRKVCYL